MTNAATGLPPNSLKASDLIRELIIEFARRHGGNFNLEHNAFDFTSPEPALELAKILQLLGCTSVIVMLQPFSTAISWTLPAGITPPPNDDKHRRGGPGLEMNVRFTPEEKAALEKLAAAEERSQQQILMRIAGPLVLEAARQLR